MLLFLLFFCCMMITLHWYFVWGRIKYTIKCSFIRLEFGLRTKIPPLLSGVRHRFCTLIKHYIPDEILLAACLIWRGEQENRKARMDKHMPFTDAKKRRTPVTNDIAVMHRSGKLSKSCQMDLTEAMNIGLCGKSGCWHRYWMHALVPKQAPKIAQPPSIHMNSRIPTI